MTLVWEYYARIWHHVIAGCVPQSFSELQARVWGDLTDTYNIELTLN